MKKYLTKEDMADRLQVSLHTLTKYIARGLPHVPMGTAKNSLIRFDPDAVEAWMSEQMVTKTPADVGK